MALGAARPRIDRHNRIATVIGPAQHPAHLQPPYPLFGRFEFLQGFCKQSFLAFLLGHLNQHFRIIQTPELGVHRLDNRLKRPLFLHQPLRALRIVPKPRFMRFRRQTLDFLPGVIDVKDTSVARRNAI